MSHGGTSQQQAPRVQEREYEGQQAGHPDELLVPVAQLDARAVRIHQGQPVRLRGVMVGRPREVESHQLCPDDGR